MKIEEDNFFNIPSWIEVPNLVDCGTRQFYYHTKKYYKNFYDWIDQLYPNIQKWSEKYFLFIHKIKEPPLCEYCKINYVKFKCPSVGYNQYCCTTCQSRGTREQSRKTLFEHFGVEIPLQSKEIQNKMKNTNKILHGDENYNNRQKSWETTYRHLGVKYPMQSKQTQIKSQETCQEHFGVTNPYQIPEVRKKAWKSNSKHHTKFEITIQNFIKNIKICRILYNNKTILDGFELDIYLQKIKLAIETNGSYWHSLKKKDKGYHIDKFKQCLRKGIELINVWSDWNLGDIFNFLKDKLEGNDLTKYKELWFPDLKENEWPLDLGWYKGAPPNNIISHKCYHEKFECCDSGIILI